MRSGPALAAVRKLEPLQSGLAKRGPEAFCHSLWALREQGYAILRTDFRNGFSAISRQAVLDAVQRLCPELNALMNLFYTVDGACFFAVDGVVKVILSAEGRQILSRLRIDHKRGGGNKRTLRAAVPGPINGSPR